MTQPARKKRLTLPLLRARAEKESSSLPDIMLAAQKAAQTMMTGDHAQRKTGSGEQFWQFRHYDPSDKPQDIDWRQSAKGDHIFVRQKEQQTIQTVLFWCDRHDGMDYKSSDTLPKKSESAAILSLALAILMQQAGEQTGLLHGTMRPGRTDLVLQKLGQDFLKTKTTALPATATIKTNADLVLCGDFLSPPQDIENALRPFAEHAGTVLLIQVLDPAELTLPFSGRAVFENHNGAEHHHVLHVDSVRAAYQDRIDQHLSAIRALCHKFGWHWALHTTDRPTHDTLSDIRAMLDQQKGQEI